ncbi:MAG: CRISPR-associated protein Cas5 [Candidatus Ratteibacteria bacterium]
MKALIFDIKLNSLYSIRIPFTWQSALTYPILPPSAVIGMLANALQRYENDKHPVNYLKEIEENIIWAGSRLLSPCIVKSYTTSAITKWEDKLGGKFTNALGRQFAYTKELQIVGIFKNSSELLNQIVEAITSTTLTCGDSESPISIEGKPEIKSVNVEEILQDVEIETNFLVPFTKDIEIIEGSGLIYLMHDRCIKKDSNFPLRSYIVPIQEKKGILYPIAIKLKLKGAGLKIYIINKILNIIHIPETSRLNVEERKKSKRKKGST